MAKNTCDCKDENYTKGQSNPTFWLFNRFNPEFAPSNRNPRTFTLLQAQKEKLNTNRTNNDSCQTPYRVPYNQNRKIKTCDTTCLSNEKIIKDSAKDGLDNTACVSAGCRAKSYASTRLIGAAGIRLAGTSRYKTLLQFNGKLYEQNAAGLLPENADLSGS